MNPLSRQVYTPLVLDLWVKGSRCKATLVEVTGGTTLRTEDFHVNSRLIPLLGSKKRACEKLLQFGHLSETRAAMREIGELVYESIFSQLGLEHLFTGGGFRVNVHAQSQARAIPVEIAHCGRFVFEGNIVSLRGKNDISGSRVGVERVLIVADPTVRFAWALREGMLLYDFFTSMGLSVTLVCRPLTGEAMNDLFASADIVHFCGHVTSWESRVGWDMGTVLFDGSDCIRGRVPALVFSNGCGNTLPLGFTFLSAGVRNCIATRWQIPDADHVGFILAFYECLFRIGDIGYAFHCSKKGRFAHEDVLPLLFALQGEPETHYEISNT
jgi:hypothetical protein